VKSKNLTTKDSKERTKEHKVLGTKQHWISKKEITNFFWHF